MNHLFCFGFGYTAQRLVRKLNVLEPMMWKFTGTNRSPISGDLAKYSVIFDDCLMIPDDVTHILISIPPKDGAEVVYDLFITQIAKLKKLRWIGYLSATSVYGDAGGAWVDEESDTSNCGDIGARRVVAEKMWLSSELPVNVFRLAGIYGPGRSAIESAMAKKLHVINKPDSIFSRIHVDDIVQTLVFAMDAPGLSKIYNVSDDYPCNPKEVADYACKLLGINPPEPVDIDAANMSEMGRYFYTQSKKVSNHKIKEVLGVELLYPTFKEGLLSVLNESGYLSESIERM